MTARGRSRRRRKGLFMTWAGDSLLRRFIAWLGQSAILAAMLIAVYLVVMTVLVPWMTSGVVDVMQHTAK
jgi:hypothetical protein